MVTIEGRIEDVRAVNKDGKKPYTSLTVYSNGIGRAELLNVRDYRCRPWERGRDARIVVSFQLLKFADGGGGLFIFAADDQLPAEQARGAKAL